MKYISIDIETTGLNTENDCVLEFAAIIEDTKNPLPYEDLPKFHCFIKHDVYTSTSPYAINMNSRIFEILANESPYSEEYKILKAGMVNVSFKNFLIQNDINVLNPILVAGKNVMSFDIPFIKNLPNWNIKFSHRHIDPSMLFTDFLNDSRIPNLETCKKRAGFENSKVSHIALDDAWDVIKLIRAKQNDKG